MKVYCLRYLWTVSALFLLAAQHIQAANGTWNGTQDACWTNSANWSASPYPSGVGDIAYFTGAGNGNTTVDLTGFTYIRSLVFDTSSVAAYTIGAGAAGSQAFVLADNGEIALTAAAGNSQIFNCGVQLGGDRTAQYYTIRNDSPSQTLTFTDIFGCPVETSGNVGIKTLTLLGSGPISLNSVRPVGASGITLTSYNTNTISLSGSNTLLQANFNGITGNVLDIGDKELFLNNGGGCPLNVNQDTVITGSGTLRLSTSDTALNGGYNYADLNVPAGRTLTVYPSITGLGGIEIWSGTGTFVFKGANTFLGHICFGTSGGTLVASSIGNRGSLTSNLGAGTNIYFSANGRLVYTGSGESSDRLIVLNGGDGRIEQSGASGKLTFTATPILMQSKTLYLQGSTAGTGEFSAPLSNTGANTLSLAKLGSGTWLLSGTNTYTGSTIVNCGKLLVNSPGGLLGAGSPVAVNYGAILGGSGTFNASVTVNTGGMLAPGDVNSAGTMNLNSTLSLTSATLLYDLVAPDGSSSVTDKVSAASTLTLSGVNTITVNFPNGYAPAGSYTLMTFPYRTGTGTFVLSPAYPNVSLYTNATTVRLDVGPGGAKTLLWKGDSSANWDGTDTNWRTNGTAVAFASDDPVAFDDTASLFTVNSSATVSPSSTLFNNSLNNYTVSAPIGGTGTIYKLGSGEVTLTGNNSFASTLTIASGLLRIGEGGVLGAGNFRSNIVNNGELVYATTIAQTNSGMITGSGNLTVSAGSSLTLSGTNGYSGLTLVTNALLRLGSANAIGPAGTGVVVAVGGVLELGATPTGIVYVTKPIELRGKLTSQGAGTNTWNGVISMFKNAVLDVAPNSTLFVNASTPDVGTNAVSKTGSGTLRFTADPNHKSNFTVAEGTVELAHSGSTDAPFFIKPGATLRDLTASDIGDFFVQNDGTLDLRVAETVGGLSGSGLVTNSGSIAITLIVGAGNQPGEFSGVIRDGSGTNKTGLAKTGTGVQTLSGANTHSGGTTHGGGVLNINHASALGTGTFTIGAYSFDNASGANLTLASNIPQSWSGDFTFIGSKSLNLGTGAATLTANRIVTVLTNTLSVGGAVGGAFSLTKNGAGALVLSGANTYSGATAVNGGALIVNSPGSLASGSAVTVGTGAIFGGNGTVNGTVAASTNSVLAPGGLNTIGTLTLANASATALQLNGATLLFDLGNISGVGTNDQIALTGTGSKVVLTGVNRIALNIPTNGIPAGTYTLISSQAGTTTNAGASVALLTPYPNAELIAVGNSVVLNVTGTGIAGALWKGAYTGLWDGSDLNWLVEGAEATYPASAAAVFDDTAAGNFTVSSAAAVSPATLAFNNSANDYTISAQLSGTGPLTKQGSAAVTLAAASAYNPAAIAINDGTLTLGSSSQLNSGAYAGDIFNNGSLVFASSAAQTFSGMLSGYGALLKSGNGTLTLGGSNLYNGATIINSGILKIQHAYGLGSTTSGTTVNPAGTLELAGGISTLAEALSLNGTLSSQTSGTNTFNGTTTLTSGSKIDVGSGSILVLKAFQANGPFVKTGLGRLALTTDPNGNGLMTVREGSVDIATGTMDANVVVNSGATLYLASTALNSTSSRLQVDASATCVVRADNTIGGFAGAGLVNKDATGTATLTFGGNNMPEIFSGVIANGSGTLAIKKQGTAAQIMSGASTYTGATTVSGGSLFILSPGSLGSTAVTVSGVGTVLGGDGSIQGAVSVAANSFLMPGVSNTIGTLTLGSTLSLSGSTLLCDVPASSASTPDRVAVTGALTLGGTNLVVLAFPAGAAAAGDYTLMTFASKTGTGTFQLAAPYPNASLVLSATSLVLHIVGSGTSGLTWNGGVSTLWDGTDANWLLGATPSTFADGSAVLFDDTALSFNVGSADSVTPSALIFNNSINPYTVAANIAGTAPLYKYGSSVAYLMGTAYNPNSINLYAGSLYLSGAAQLNAGTYTSNITINSGTFVHNSTAAQTLSGFISGSGALTKTGAGTLAIYGSNTLSGTVTSSAGTLYAQGYRTALGTGALSLGGGALELDHDSGLAFTNNTTLTASTTIRSGRLTYGPGVTNALGTLSIGNMTLSVAPGLNLQSGTPYGVTFGNTAISTHTAVFDVANNGSGIGYLTLGVLSGNNFLTKQGAGTLFLGAASTRASATNTLTAGTLKLGHPNALGTNQVSLILVLNGGVLDLATDTTVTNYTTVVGGSATILSDKATPGSAGITHILGPLTLNSNLSVTTGANVSVGSPFGVSFGATTLGATPTVDVAAGGTLTLGSTSGNFGLTKAGNGVLVFGSANAYTGVTAITRGKVIISGASACITNVSAITLSGNSTLELRNSTASNVADRVRNNIPITLTGGSISYSHTGGTANYSESMGTLNVAGSTNAFFTSQAAAGYTSIITLTALSRANAAVINFVGDGLGDSDRNRIFITGQPEGNIGPWAMVNGTNFAYYSATKGVCATATTYDLAARGPDSVIPNDSNTVARITTTGVAGPITLAADITNQIFAVRQNTGTDAVIATLGGTTNKILRTHGLYITDGKASLSVGEKSNDGVLTALVPAEGLLFDVDGAAGVLTVNAQILDVGGNVPVKKYGNGRVVFAGQNVYSNTTTVYEGTLVAQHANALGSSAVGGTVVNTNATLEIAGSITSAAEALTLYGTLSSQSGVNTFAGTVTPVYGSFIDVSASSILMLSAAPSTSGSGGFIKTGAGILRLTGDPNQTGLYIINAGTLELAHSGSTDAAISIAPGATLREITSGDIGDLSVTNNGTLDMRATDTIGMLVGNGLVTVGTGLSPTLAIGNESGKTATFSGVIENGRGVLSLQKSGTSTQILTGTNTYTGTTVINERSGRLLVNNPGVLLGTASVTVNSGGTLGGNGSVMSPVTVASGGALLPADEGVIGTLTVGGSLTLNDATIFVDVPATVSASDLISVAGSLTVNGVNTIALSFPGGVASAGDYTLMTFASRSGTGSFVVLGLSSTPNATLELTDTSLILHVSSGSAFGLTWFGGLSTVWDGGALNWKSNGSSASYTDGNMVTLDDNTVNFTVSSVGSSVAPSAIYFNNNTNTYTINAMIAGTAPLVKSGWGSVLLNNVVNYNPSSITVNPVGALYIGNASNARLNNGAYSNPIFLNGGIFRFESGASLTLNSLVTGGGSIQKYGAGTLTLNSANTYRGGTTHGAGQMNINNGGTDATASSIGIGRLYIGSGAIFDVTGGSDVTLATSNPMDWNGDFIYAGSSNNFNFGTGAVNINSGSRTITVWNNTLAIGGAIAQNGGTYGLTKAGPGSLILSGASTYAGTTTLSGGTLFAQKNGAALGTGALTLNTSGTVLDYGNDTALTFNNAATVSAPVTVRAGRLTTGPGVTHTLGTLSINANTLSVAVGTNTIANTPYGLTYGATTLTAAPAVFNVQNNGGAPGVLTLGAVSGNYALVKKGDGVLKLATVSLLSGPITNMNGRVLGVTGGSCSNSAVTLQAAELANAAAALGVLCNAAGSQWTCTNLVTAVSVAPAASRPALDFSFLVSPSTTVAPLRVLNSVSFDTNPVVNVYLSGVATATTNYPLMVVGGTAPTTVIPTLNMVGGYTNSYLYWTNNTLTLRLNGSANLIKWMPGAISSGTWDVNNSANLVWTNNVAVMKTYYQDPFGVGASGDNVLFDDTGVAAAATVTLAGSPSPSSVVMTNSTYAYTITGSGNISGIGPFSKFGTNLLTLATANTSTGATTFASGVVNIPAGAGINVGNLSNAGLLNVGTVVSNTVLNINGGTVNASKTSIPALQVGTTSGTIGAINLTSGSLYTGSELWLGAGGSGQNAFGVLNVTGGSVTSANYLALGRATAATGSNRGELLISGGTVAVTAYNIEIGSYQNSAASTSVGTLTGGTLTMGTGAGDFIVGNYANGVLNVSGSAAVNVLNTAKALKIGVASGVTGIVNLNGGVVTVPAVTNYLGAYGYLNFNGGTLKANRSHPAFIRGLMAARIYAGGAVIDDGGYTITIPQSLLSPCTGNGVSLAGMTFSGRGFIAPPIVDISGFGNGASAVATIDANGNLTGVTLTSPGANYHTGVPALTFTGGGGWVTQTGIASTAPNTCGGLTKLGAGTVTLAGVNTYSGATLVNGGRLALVAGASCSNSVVTVQSIGVGTNALFGVTYAGADAQSAIAGLVTASGLGGGATPDLEFAFSAVPSATTAPLVVKGDATFSVTPEVRVILSGLTVPNGAYPLMAVEGAAPSAVPPLTLAGGYTGSSLSWSGNTLMLNVAGSAATIKWATGAVGNGTWNVNDGTNLVWKYGASAPTFYQETPGSVGDQVIFDDAFISLNNTVTLNTTVTPAGVAANNSTFAFTLTGSGAIAGTNALVKSGAANFRLSTANTYSGGTLVNAGGVLQVSSAGGLGTGAVVNNGTMNLDANAGTTTDTLYTGLNNGLSGAGTNNVSLGTSTAQMQFFGNYSSFIGVWNIGVGAYAGASRAVMTNLDNAAATINVLTNGTLWVSAAGTHNAAINLYGGDTGESYGQLRLDAGLWAGPVVLMGQITGSGDAFFGSQSANGEIAGTISEVNGPYVVSKVGSFATTFSGANTYLGPTHVMAGALRVPALGSISGGPSPLGAPTTSAQGTVKLGYGGTAGSLLYYGNGETSDRVIDMAGTTGGATIDMSGTNLLKLTGNLTCSGIGVKTLTLQGSTIGTGELAGIISNTPYGNAITIVKSGSGTWKLSNANAYSGGTTINLGTVIVANPTALGTNVVTFPGTTGVVDFAQDGVGEYANDYIMNVNAIATFKSNRTSPGDGINHNVGALHLSGVTVYTTNGDNVVSGKATVTVSSVDLMSGATYTTVLAPMTADLIVSGGVSILQNAYAKTLLLDGTGSGSAILGPITNGLGSAVSLAKANVSTWTLCGSNTYSGATAITNGAIVLAGTNGAILGTSAITLSGNAVLELRNNVQTNLANRLGDAVGITMSGGTLRFAHTGGAADYSERLGALAANASSNTFATSLADIGRTSVVTIASLSLTGSATMDFTGEGLGTSDRNRVYITGQTEGPIGSATINGTNIAAYSSALGVYAFGSSGSDSITNLAARGNVPNSVVPDNAASLAQITEPGDSGPITLAGSWTNRVFALIQNNPVEATVDTISFTTNKTLLTTTLAVAAGQSSLTVGAAAGNGYVAPLTAGGNLRLENDDDDALLTVNAAVVNNTSASAVSKFGPGTAVLAGSNTFSGAVTINEGTLEFGGPYGQRLSGVIGGTGTLSKSGTNVLHVLAANTYAGPTTIKQGTVRANENTTFGTTNNPVYITDGGTLNVGCTPDVGGTRSLNTINFGNKQFVISGAGYQGIGAIVNISTSMQYNAFGRIALAGDATIGGPQRFDMNNVAPVPALDLNGFTLTKTGACEFAIHNVQINPGETGKVLINQGLLRFETGSWVNGTSNNTVTVSSGGKLEMYQLTNASPSLWSVIVNDGSFFQGGGTLNVTNQNIWNGPITLNGTTFFNAGSTPTHWTVNGDISGPGKLVKMGGSPTVTATLWLYGTNNTYSGGTIVSNGTLFARHPGSLPGYDSGKVTIAPAATLSIPSGDGTVGWGAQQIQSLHDTGTFASNTAVLYIDTAPADVNYQGNLSKTLALTKMGNNTLTLNWTNTFGGTLTVGGGTLNLPSTSTNAVGLVLVTGGATNRYLNIDGPLSMGTNTLYVGATANDRAIVTLSANATMGKMFVGNGSASYGSFTHEGGDLYVGSTLPGGYDILSLANNTSGYGYYRMLGGTLTTGQLGINGSGGGNGVFEQYGGRTTINGSGGWLVMNWGAGASVLNIFGGTMITPPGNPATMAFNGTSGNLSCLNMLGPDVLLDTSANSKQLNMAGASGAFLSALNLNGGTLVANRVYAGYAGTPTVFGFNGGTLRAAASSTTFMQGLSAALVYPDGAVIDSSNAVISLTQSLWAPTGYGVTYIPVLSGGTNYIGAPAVKISGGSGFGATAIATVDLTDGSPTKGQVTGITITSPGTGYLWYDAPVATLLGGGATTPATLGTCSLSLNSNAGGLTKNGSGTLTLAGTNTYGGTTLINSGTLRLGLANALPPNADVVLAGGTYDLGACYGTISNGTVTVLSGLVTNGTINASITKTGDGNATLAAAQETAQPIVVSGGTLKLVSSAGSQVAGLYEGTLGGSFNTSEAFSACSNVTVQLGTRLADTNKPPWVDNVTYVYSGYIWNRTGTNATWTFVESIDDSTLLKIDGTTLINDGNYNVPALGTVTLTPGPHAFEARFGNGTGGAGLVYNTTGVGNGLWWTNRFGFGIDYQGRTATNAPGFVTNFVPCTDPGNGSLLTLVPYFTGSSVLNSNSTIFVDAGATLDLGKTTQTVSQAGGSGTISNGTLAVTGFIAPGGTNVIGTLTAASTTINSGTLLVDVDTDGHSDCLAVQGNIDLSKLTLQIANTSQLNKSKAYTVLTCAGGTRAGSLTAVNLPDSHWKLVYRSNGTVQLLYVDGTLLRIR